MYKYNDTVLTSHQKISHKKKTQSLQKQLQKENLDLKNQISDLKKKIVKKEEALQTEISRRNEIQQRYEWETRKSWQYIYIADVFFITVNSDEMLAYVNKKVQDTLGYSRKQMIGKNFFDCFVHEDDRKKSRDIFAQMMEGKERTLDAFECRVLTLSGDNRLIALHYLPIRDKQESIIRIIAFGEDITKYRQFEKELDEKTRYLEESNHALKLMVDHRDVEKRAVEESIVRHFKTTISPYLEELEKCKLDQRGKTCLEIVKAGIEDVPINISRNISLRYMDLTPAEVQVAELIRQGKTSKEIAEFMFVSPSTVSFHRNNLRKKLGILQKKTNLRSYLSSLSN